MCASCDRENCYFWSLSSPFGPSVVPNVARSSAASIAPGDCPNPSRKALVINDLRGVDYGLPVGGHAIKLTLMKRPAADGFGPAGHSFTGPIFLPFLQRWCVCGCVGREE